MIVMGAVAYACLARVAEDATAIQKDAMPGMAVSGQLNAAWLDNFALTQKHVLENRRSRYTHCRRAAAGQPGQYREAVPEL